MGTGLVQYCEACVRAQVRSVGRYMGKAAWAEHKGGGRLQSPDGSGRCRVAVHKYRTIRPLHKHEDRRHIPAYHHHQVIMRHIVKPRCLGNTRPGLCFVTYVRQTMPARAPSTSVFGQPERTLTHFGSDHLWANAIALSPTIGLTRGCTPGLIGLAAPSVKLLNAGFEDRGWPLMQRKSEKALARTRGYLWSANGDGMAAMDQRPVPRSVQCARTHARTRAHTHTHTHTHPHTHTHTHTRTRTGTHTHTHTHTLRTARQEQSKKSG